MARSHSKTRWLGGLIGVALAFFAGWANAAGEKPVTFTVIYDNYLVKDGVTPQWGFACFIEGLEKTILFDTGSIEDILCNNAKALDVDLDKVDVIVISHNHGDHTGGLGCVLKHVPNASIFCPATAAQDLETRAETSSHPAVIAVDGQRRLCKDAFLTGEMGIQIKEQSLIVDTPNGLVVVTGCSHQGIVSVLQKCKEISDKKIYLVFGGFHLLNHSEEQVRAIIAEFKALGVEKCGATHCTGDNAIALFREAFAENFETMGVGRVVQIPTQ